MAFSTFDGFVLLTGFYGVISAFFGLLYRRAKFAARRSMENRVPWPVWPVAQAPGQGRVAIRGRIVAASTGPVVAPFTQRSAVWARVRVETLAGLSGRLPRWVASIDETVGGAFFLDDGSGQLARVELGPAHTNIVVERWEETLAEFAKVPAPIEAYFAAKGRSDFLKGRLGVVRFVETSLPVGSELHVVGPARREAGPPVSDGYRMVPSSQLVLQGGWRDREELWVGDKDPQAQAPPGSLWLSLVIAWVGVVLAVGAAATVFGPRLVEGLL